MRFSCEDAQTHFHSLKTQTQHDWLKLEERLAELGYFIECGFRIDGTLEVSVCINEKPNLRPYETKDSATD